jgi:hypothetical protein
MKTACIEMVGPDEQMDQVGDDDAPANRLRIRCSHCSFPDIDFVPKPYLLAKGFSSPSEISSAEMGNFFVKDRVKRILEVVIPKACTFYATAERKSKKATPWFLAVPNSLLKIPAPKAEAPFCSKCRESKRGQSFANLWKKMKDFDSGGVDIFKSTEWDCMSILEDDFESTNEYRAKEGDLEPLPWSEPGIEPPSHSERWSRRGIDRELYFSKRLEQLLKRLKVKSQLVAYIEYDDVQPTSDDEKWIRKSSLCSQKRLSQKLQEPRSQKTRQHQGDGSRITCARTERKNRRKLTSQR